MQSTIRLSHAMIDELPREDVLSIVDRMVEEMVTAAGITTPPVDAIALAQGHLGMVVLLDKRQAQRGRAQRAAGRKQIYLRPEPREERHQWTVAHEIGEHVKTDLLLKLGLNPDSTQSMTGESLANLFANRLLVPSRWFKEDARRLEFDLEALKKRYSTSSYEVLAMRFLDLSEPCIVTIIDNERITRRRSNAWPTRKKLEPVEEKCVRLVHKTGIAQRLQEQGWTVTGWPVHQPEWKREILRSVVDEFPV